MSIEAEGLTKAFGTPPIPVLSPLTFSVKDGEFLSITGRSGCGKSTLLYLLSTLDAPTTGKLKIDGVDTATLSEKALHDFRNRHMGFVFQFHYLLPEINVLENVLMPARRTGERESREDRARKLLADFSLAEKVDRLPSELSGGERQRVAIARALVMEPRYIFADEPTGNLDSANGETVLRILEAASRVGGATVVFVTHDRDYAARADRQLKMLDGKIVEIAAQPKSGEPRPLTV